MLDVRRHLFLAMSMLRTTLCRYFEDRGNYDPEDFLFAYGDPSPDYS